MSLRARVAAIFLGIAFGVFLVGAVIALTGWVLGGGG